MKLQFYIAIVSGILIAGTVAGNLRDTPAARTPSPALTENLERRYRDRAAEIAGNAQVRNVVSWGFSDDHPNTVALSGLNAEGDAILTVHFSRSSHQPVTLLHHHPDSTPLPECAGKQPREVARFWLRRIGLADDEAWHFVREGITRNNRRLTYWRGGGNTVSVAVDVQTGHLRSLRLLGTAGPCADRVAPPGLGGLRRFTGPVPRKRSSPAPVARGCSHPSGPRTATAP